MPYRQYKYTLSLFRGSLCSTQGTFHIGNRFMRPENRSELKQDQPDRAKKPFVYWSRMLNGAEQNYDTTNRECLAVERPILFLRPAFEGQNFTVRNKHAALKRIFGLANFTERLSCWTLRIPDIYFDFIHRAGIQHQAMNTLSGLVT